MPKLFTPRKFFARLDAKRRLTLRGAKHNQFVVQSHPDGSFVAKPLVLAEDVLPKAPVSPSARKARALKIAAKGGPKTLAVVKRMGFRKANAREKAIAATLTRRASAALKRHAGGKA